MPYGPGFAPTPAAAGQYPRSDGARVDWATIPIADVSGIRFRHQAITGINLNSATTDVGTFSNLPAKYRILRLGIYGASTSLTTATVDLRDATGGAGNAIVSAFAPSALTAAAKVVDATLTITDIQTVPVLIVRNVTAQGGAATANFYLEYVEVP